jgi:hypothetical protein
VNAASLAARALELLGPFEGPIAVEVPRASRLAVALAAGRRVATRDEPPVAAVVVFVGVPASPSERQAALDRLHERLSTGAPVVLVDHNQPRAWWRRALALAPLLAAGHPPARARYPVARELAARGFTVDRLRLARGERVQLVVARRR